jgi:hypothetical protein
MSAPVLIAEAPTTKTENRWLIALLLLAGLLRAGLVWWKWDWLAVDRDLYLELGRNVAEGNGFALLRSALFSPTAYRPPLYPLMIATILWFGGGLWTIAVVQIGLGTTTVWLTWRIGHRLGLGILALFGAALVAFNPLLIQATVLPMTETLCSFLLAGYLSVHLCGKYATRPFALGVWLGLAALCRPTVWAFAFLGGFAALFASWRSSAPGSREVLASKWRSWCVTVVAVVLTVMPWGIRNWCVFDRMIVTTTHGGYTLLLGNNDDAYRHEVLAVHEDSQWDSVFWQGGLEQEALNAGISQRSEVARDNWMARKARNWIRQHPREFAELCWLRVKRFWNIFPGGTDAGSLPMIARYGVAAFFLLELIAAVIGLWKLRRDEWSVWWPLVLLVASFALVHVVYWSNPRMRAPVEPVLALLAARGFVGWRNNGRPA